MMIECAHWLLAQSNASRLRGIRESIRSGEPSDGLGAVWLFLLLLVVLLVVLGYLWVRSQGDQTGHRSLRSSRRLFADSMVRLGVGQDDQSLLRRIIQEVNLAHPAAILLNAAQFDKIAGQWLSTQPPDDRREFTLQLHSIRERVFTRKGAPPL